MICWEWWIFEASDRLICWENTGRLSFWVPSWEKGLQVCFLGQVSDWGVRQNFVTGDNIQAWYFKDEVIEITSWVIKNKIIWFEEVWEPFLEHGKRQNWEEN